MFCIQKLAEEFSHTVLHGENIKKNIQGMNKPTPVGSKFQPSPRPGSAAAATPVIIGAGNGAGAKQPLYDPAKVYKTPLVRRPSPGLQKLQQSNEKKLPVSAIRKRPATPVAPRAPAATNESKESLDLVDLILNVVYYFEIHKLNCIYPNKAIREESPAVLFRSTATEKAI